MVHALNSILKEGGMDDILLFLSFFLSFFLSSLSLRLRRMKTIFSSKYRFETSEAGFPNVTVDLRTFFYLNS